MKIDGIIEQMYQNHKAKTEEWTHGKPVKAWLDDNKVLCIQYEDSNWWHYDNGKWW